MNDIARYRKAAVAVAGVLGQVLAAGVLPPTWQPWAAVALALATALGVYQVPNAPQRAPLSPWIHGGPRDRGAASLRQLWWMSGTFGAALLLIGLTIAVGPADAHQRPAACPAGYQLAEVHLTGQWIGSGLDPVTHATRPELVQSADPATAARYVVALACIRDLTAAERDAERAGLSTTPLVLPLVLDASKGHWS